MKAAREQTNVELGIERQRTDDELAPETITRLRSFERAKTDRTLAQEREVSDRYAAAQEDMLAVVAHDLRNMLNVIVINASVILMADDATNTLPLAEGIQKIGAQMNLVLEDVLDFSTMQAGSLGMHTAPTDIVQLVRDAVAINASAATASKIELVLSTSVDRLVLEADSRRIMRVVLNVLSNAVKFTPPGGRVSVNVERVGSELEIAISDTGPGIAPDELETIFERYRQARSGTWSGGVGLGLYIARAIVAAHGGRIWAESELGSGATFKTRLPVGKARETTS
ncbi:MAG TPA: HAMP domain-containing sensor histidine kinase [Kofleriaceae bacterium]